MTFIFFYGHLPKKKGVKTMNIKNKKGNITTYIILSLEVQKRHSKNHSVFKFFDLDEKHKLFELITDMAHLRRNNL